MNCNHGKKQLNIRLAGSIFLSGIIILVLLFPRLVTAQTLQTDTALNHDKEKYEQLIKNLKDANEAVQFAKDAMKLLADSAQFPQLLFQLSELEYRRDKLLFEAKMIKYDFQLHFFEKGKISVEPEEPQLTHENSLSLNNRILEEFPEVDFKNQVLYRNGMIYYELGQRDRAKEIFQQLIPEFQENSVKAELIFRIGECFFDEEKYDQALVTYQQILESWDSPFFAMSLYKIAWCHYRKNQISDAITTFYYLLNDIRLMEKLDSEILGKSQLELRQEVIDYIAISFSEFGGADALLNFMQTMGESDYKADLLFKLGNIYFNRSFFEESIECFEKLSTVCPTNPKIPQAASLWFDALTASGKMNQAIELRAKFERQCRAGSAWAIQNFASENKLEVEQILQKMDFKIASPLLVTADSLFAIEDYSRAYNKYKKFVTSYPTDERADRASFCLAECSFNQKNYDQAAEEYLHIIENFSASKFFAEAAYNRVLCFDQMWNSVRGTAEDTTAVRENPVLQLLIRSCKSFLELVPKSDKSPEILLKLAEIYFVKKMYTLSEQYARPALVQILKNKQAEPYKASAMNLLAQIAFQQKKFESAEKLFSALIKHFPDSTDLITRSEKMMASAHFKIGDQLKSRGKYLQAAINYEQTASRTSDPVIAEAALFEAALQFEQCGELLRAAENCEKFCQKYPQSQKFNEALFRAATLRERLGHWQIAARNYEKLQQVLGNSAEGNSALFNAGLAYEKATDWYAASVSFDKFIRRVSAEDDRYLEALFKKASASQHHNPKIPAETLFRPVLAKYFQLKNSGKIADEYYAAHASYLIAEDKNQLFRSIDLKPPFQIKLQRKQQAFNELLQSYIEVSKFEVAEWTTAAFFSIGLAYEEFCNAILNSPTPENLSQQQTDAYWTTIQQKWIFPLQKEALKYYETNLNIAQKNSLENDWTFKTANRIRLLESSLAQNNALPDSEPFQPASKTSQETNKAKQRSL